MEPKLLIALKSTLSPDASQRAQGEAFLNQSLQGGLLLCLLKITFDCTNTIEPEIRIQSSIQAKLIIKKYWRQNSIYTVSDNEKIFIKENVLASYQLTNLKQVTTQVEAIIRKISKFDFPTQWTSILDKANKCLQNTSSFQNLHSTLKFIKQVVSPFKLEMHEGRAPLNLIVCQLFPCILKILNDIGLNSSDNYAIVLCILKIFKIVILLDIPPYLTQEVVTNAWISNIMKVLSSVLPTSFTSKTDDYKEIETRNKSVCWKSKSEAIEILSRLFQKYGNPSFVIPELKQFALRMEQTYNIGIIKMVIELIKCTTNMFISPRVIGCAIKCLSQALKNNFTLLHLMPIIYQLNTTVIFQQLLISQADAFAWGQNPEDYLRTLYWDQSSRPSPRSAAQEFIQLSSHHETEQNLINYFKYLVNLLNTQGSDSRLAEAVLTAIGYLSEQVKSPQMMKDIEQLLKIYAFKLLSTPSAMVQLRAAWIYGEYALINFEDIDALKSAVILLAQIICSNNLVLPLRVVAAISLGEYFYREDVQSWISANIGPLLKHYIYLFRSVDLEDLVFSIQNLVKYFGPFVRPYAVDLVNELCISFKKMPTCSKDDEKEEGKLAGIACIDTISKIISIVREDKEFIAKIEGSVIPTIVDIINSKSIDVIENSINILALITRYGATISEKMWGLYILLMQCIVGSKQVPSENKEGGWMFENLKQCAVIFQNYVSRNPQVFISIKLVQGNAVVILLNFIERILEIAKYKESEIDSIIGIRLIITIIESLKGSIDNLIPGILNMLGSQYSKAKIPNYKRMIFQVYCMAMWYNTPLTLGLLNTNNQLVDVFKLIFDHIDHLEHDFEVRYALFGVATILSTNPSQLPPLIVQGIPHIFLKAVNLCNQSIKLYDHESSDEAEEEGMSKNAQNDDDEDENDEDFDPDEDSSSEDELYVSSIENEDEILYFESVLLTLQKCSTEYYNKLMSSLTPQHIASLSQAFKRAHEIQSKQAQ